MINALVITPARIGFLVLLIGTTIEVLANQGREMFRIARWRKNMDNHVVVIGYGTKGRSAADTLIQNGLDPESIVVVDPRRSEENTSELPSLMRISYAVFCLKKKKHK